MKRAVLIGLVAAVALWAIQLNGSLEVLGTLTAAIVDFRNSTSTAPMKVGTSVPGTCTVGQTFFKTDATAGQNIYLCTATNTWTQVQGGGGGGSSNLYVQTPAAICQYSAASSPLTMHGTATPLAACRIGSNVVSAVLDFPDTGPASVQGSLRLAGAFSGVNLTLTWDTQATSGNVVWQVETACVGDGESADPSWNAAQTIVDAAQGAAGRRNDAVLNGVTTTGCAAGDTLYWKLTRDPGHASDTIGATASLHHLLWEVVR